MNIIDRHESRVRAYCRSFPTVFTKARGSYLWDERGRRYIDFFAGAGALNYGHNPPALKAALLDYITGDGITHGLDMATAAKTHLLERFNEVILKPRDMTYKIAFPGPTGTNAIECAIKIARKATARTNVISFTNAFHGMTLGSLALTGNAAKRAGAGIPLTGVDRMPFDGYLGADVDTLVYLERALEDGGSGIDMPAAVIVETLQAEGGLRVASDDWLWRLGALCKKHQILLIVDDIQVGCGRTGPFFSFERAGIDPDIICLSKSIGGYGLPLALVLVKPAHDCFEPGEHNGTFRGNNLAFVTAAEALKFWENDVISLGTRAKGRIVRARLEKIVRDHPGLDGEVRGRGLIQGIAAGPAGVAEKICGEAFSRGLIMETSGPKSEVFKVMPPLVIEEADLKRGLDILEDAVAEVMGRQASSDSDSQAQAG